MRGKLHGGRQLRWPPYCSCSGVSCAAQQFVPRDENPEDFPAGAGRDDTFYACTACHGFKLIAQQGMSRRQWEELIELMVQPAQHAAAVGEGSEDRAGLSGGDVSAARAGGGPGLAESVLAALTLAVSIAPAMDFSRKSHRSRRLPSVELSTFFA